MGRKTLTMLVALTAVVMIAGALAWQRREAAVAASGENTRVFPDLTASINDVTRVVVRSADGEVVLARDGEAWSVESKGGYPAALEPIRKALIGLTELATVEAKTDAPERWSKLGVEDVADEGSTSKEIAVFGADGKELAALVVGRPRTATGTLDELYVRKPGENQAWLVAGELTLPTVARDWLDSAITKIERDRVHTVIFERPDGETLRVERESTDQKEWNVVELGQRELKHATIANSIGNGLEHLELQDVRPVGEVDFTTDWLADATFECWNGLRVRVRTKDVDGTAWARFEAEYDASLVRDPSPAADAAQAVEGDENAEAAAAARDEAAAEKARAEAAELDADLSRWAYALPQYNRTALTKRMKDLVKEPELGTDETPVVIPSTLPPEIQQQIKDHQESLGNKWVVKDPDPNGESKLDIQDVSSGTEDEGHDAPTTPPEDGGGG